MPKVREMISEIPDEGQYDGVIYVALTGVQVANIGFGGQMPEGTDAKRYLFQKMQEAQTALAFSPSPPPDEE